MRAVDIRSRFALPLLRSIDRQTALVLTGWTLIFITVPILLWTLGQAGLTVGIALGVLAQVSAVLFVTLRAWGTRRTQLAYGITLVVAWASEFIGHNTGFPFGDYIYTDRFQPQLGGVPLLVPLAWLMMLPPAWAVGRALAGRWGGAGFVAASAVAMTAWDFFLDPQMVNWNVWQWESAGGLTYFGIPPVNFAGWLLVTALITLLVRPRDLPLAPLLAIYAITWALQFIGQLFFWGLPGPALVGSLVMGTVFALALLRLRKGAP
ncbi:MAG: carotenoid biosynthesis protein [Anaerolineae bacterium]|nr:carotenoid biosynthesis protein [Anaerolineae bacterium]